MTCNSAGHIAERFSHSAARDSVGLSAAPLTRVMPSSTSRTALEEGYANG